MEIDILTFFDLLVTGVIIYKLLTLIKKTRAIQLVKGIAILFLITFVSQRLGFEIFNFLLEELRTMVLIAIPVVFQPELRRGLRQLGRGQFFQDLIGKKEFNLRTDQMVTAAVKMSENKTGCLMVLKRETGLQEIIDTGVEMDAKVTIELLVSIFFPKSPLHDGAIVIEDERILAASCLLPLSDNQRLKQSLGTRHRAAIGMSEESDALVVIVSEETGNISTAFDGKIKYNLDEFGLKEEILSKFDNLKDTSDDEEKIVKGEQLKEKLQQIREKLSFWDD